MELSQWLVQHGVDLIQTAGIVGGLFFTAYALRKDERARRIGNSIAINEQHRRIWKTLYDHPGLRRVLSKEAGPHTTAVTAEEELFVTSLILHLNTVYQAMKHGEFITLEGLKLDVSQFFALPIPREVWNRNKQFQNGDFVTFIDNFLV